MSCALIIALALVACSSSSDGTQAPADADDESSRRPHRDAQTSPRDAHGAPDARRGDAAVASDAGGGTTGDGGGGLAGAGVVACYSEYAPSATCALPTHCCFTNYSAARAGSCETAACTWGTIDCDGPEDCATGQRCCAHVIIDPDNGITGYKLACQTDACGAAPANVELCHGGATAAGTCDGDRACVSVANQDYDLPRTLSTCR